MLGMMFGFDARYAAGVDAGRRRLLAPRYSGFQRPNSIL